MMWGKNIREPIRNIDMAYVYGIRAPRISVGTWVERWVPRLLGVLILLAMFAAMFALIVMA